MSDEMRGLFFIAKGHYLKGVAPAFVNKETNETQHIGGFDPYNEKTEEWYMLMDCKTFHCIACGSDLERVLKGVYTSIKKHKGVAKRYFKHVSNTTSDDYYETHYLGKRPLTREELAKKAKGRCPRVSPVMRCLYERIYEEYGDFFSDEIREMEDLAYSELREDKPIHKTKKLVAKTKKNVGGVEITPKKEEVIDTPTPKKLKSKVKLGVKKLSMG